MRTLLAALSVATLASAAIPSLASADETQAGQAAAQTAEAEGVVKAIDAGAGRITLQHGRIAALNWPAMTMTFKATSPAVLNGIQVGQKVHFVLKTENGGPVVTAIHPRD